MLWYDILHIFDRYGRRVILLVAVGLQTVVSVAICFSPDVYSFMVMRVATGVLLTGAFQVGYVLGESTLTIVQNKTELLLVLELSFS